MIEQYKKYSILAIIIFLSILSFIYSITNKNFKHQFVASPVNTHVPQIEEEPLQGESNNEPVQNDFDLPKIVQKIPVYVCGEVHHPDVYYLDETAIIKEAIMMAGGFTDGANRTAWNLAMQIQRGLKIDVPKIGEEIDKIVNSYDNSIEGSDTQSNYNNGTYKNTQHLVNINRASAGELTTLPGIGPVIAQNIIQYREKNGAFRSLQDVGNVARIGPATLEKIKNHICFQ